MVQLFEVEVINRLHALSMTYRGCRLTNEEIFQVRDSIWNWCVIEEILNISVSDQPDIQCTNSDDTPMYPV